MPEKRYPFEPDKPLQEEHFEEEILEHQAEAAAVQVGVREGDEPLPRDILEAEIERKDKQLKIAAIAFQKIRGRVPRGRTLKAYCCPVGNELAAFAMRDMRMLGDFPGANLGKIKEV